jgi:glycerate dehydrogenase
VGTPNIVILDAAPALTGLDISGLSALGVVTAYESTQPEQLAERMLNADIVITNKCRIDDALFAVCSGLKGISVLATGLDNIALDAAAARGIGVRNVAGYSTPSTAQLALGLLLAAAHNIVGNAVHVAHGGWQQRGVWSYTLRPMLEISGSTIGIIGYGNIGKAIAAPLVALGANVVPIALPGREKTGHVPLADAIRALDAIILQCPLTPETSGLVDDAFLAQLKPGAILVNTARGPVVDPDAVCRALDSGLLSCYAADVMETEPPRDGHALTGHPKAIVTPHVAWSTDASRNRLLEATIENVRGMLSGS